MLLVGVHGSGKQSLTRVAAHAAGYTVFEVTVGKGYGEAAFLEDLKDLFMRLVNDNAKVLNAFSTPYYGLPKRTSPLLGRFVLAGLNECV